MPRLTKTIVDRLSVPSGKGDAFAWCADLKGFGARARPSGAKTFLFKYRMGRGRGAPTRRETIGKYGAITVDQARDAAKLMAAKVARGEDPSLRDDASALASKTVAELIADWAAGPALINRRTGEARDPKNVALEASRLDAHVVRPIGDRRAASITKADIAALRDKIVAGETARTEPSGKLRGVRRVAGGPGTAARTLRTLQSVFAHALDEGLVETNPVIGVRLAPDKKHERFLSEAEVQRMGAALDAFESAGGNPHAANIVRALALTGARYSEIMGLQWRELDFDRGFLRLDRSKTGRSQRALSTSALTFFESLARIDVAWVFPATRGDGPFRGTPKAWRTIRDAADLSDVRLHDLRHSFASFAAAGGLSLPLIGALLGHRTPGTTARYAHLADDPARRGAEAAAAPVAKALGHHTPRGEE